MRTRRPRRLEATSLLAFVLLTASASRLRAQDSAAAAPVTAERAAREWLFLLDEARYDSAWSRVAPAMRAAVSYERWATSLRELRSASALPRPLRRVLLRVEPVGELFGGSARILSFDLVPAPPAGAPLREIVVLSRIGTRWLVAGYGILPGPAPPGLTPGR